MTPTARIILVKCCGECKYRSDPIRPYRSYRAADEFRLEKSICYYTPENRELGAERYRKPGQFPSWCPLSKEEK